MSCFPCCGTFAETNNKEIPYEEQQNQKEGTADRSARKTPDSSRRTSSRSYRASLRASLRASIKELLQVKSKFSFANISFKTGDT